MSHVLYFSVDVFEGHAALLYRNLIKQATEIAVRSAQIMIATRQNDFGSLMMSFCGRDRFLLGSKVRASLTAMQAAGMDSVLRSASAS